MKPKVPIRGLHKKQTCAILGVGEFERMQFLTSLKNIDAYINSQLGECF